MVLVPLGRITEDPVFGHCLQRLDIHIKLSQTPKHSVWLRTVLVTCSPKHIQQHVPKRLPDLHPSTLSGLTRQEASRGFQWRAATWVRSRTHCLASLVGHGAV